MVLLCIYQKHVRRVVYMLMNKIDLDFPVRQSERVNDGLGLTLRRVQIKACASQCRIGAGYIPQSM